MQRPTSVTVFGVLSIIFGVMGLTCVPLWPFMPLMLLQTSVSSEYFAAVGISIPDLASSDLPALEAILIVWFMVHIFASIALLSAGVGLLKLRPWARLQSIACAVYAIIAFSAAHAVTYARLWAPLREAGAGAQTDSNPVLDGMAALAVCGGVVYLVFPILLIVFMLRPSVKRAFNPLQPPQMPGDTDNSDANEQQT